MNNNVFHAFDAREELPSPTECRKRLLASQFKYKVIDTRWVKAREAANRWPRSFVRWCESNTNLVYLHKGKAGFITRLAHKDWIGPCSVNVAGKVMSLFIKSFDVCEKMHTECLDMGLDPLTDFEKQQKRWREMAKESQSKKLKEFIAEDIKWWRLVCTSIISENSYLDKFPPSEKCRNPLDHRDWIFAALIESALIIGFDSMKEWANELLAQIAEIDEREGRNFYYKWEYVGKIQKSITTDKSPGHEERLEEAFSEIGSRNVRCAVIWMLCNKFIGETTTQTNKEVLPIGARQLFDNFCNMITTSKAMDFANRTKN